MSGHGIAGACLCGGVRYEIVGQPAFMGHCHCSICRKFSGSAYNTDIGVPREWFRLTAGDELLRVYRHEDRKDMVFCSQCGSSLFTCARWPAGPTLWVRAGTLDDDPGLRPLMRIWVGSKAPWDEIGDSLPQFREGAH